MQLEIESSGCTYLLDNKDTVPHPAHNRQDDVPCLVVQSSKMQPKLRDFHVCMMYTARGSQLERRAEGFSFTRKDQRMFTIVSSPKTRNWNPGNILP